MREALRLDGASSTYLLDTSSFGVPRCLYWGPRLGDLDEGLTLALAEPVPQASLDAPPLPSIFPEAGLGFFGQPALRGHRDRRNFATRFLLERALAAAGRIELHLEDPIAELALTITIAMDAETDVLTLTSALENRGKTPFSLDHCAAACFTLNGLIREALVFDGAWSREFSPRRAQLTRDALVRENRRGRTSHDRFPGLIAGERGFGDHHGAVYGFHLGYSGDSRIWAEILPNGACSIGLGESFAPGEIALSPGERYASPEVYAATSSEGLDGLRDRFHRFVRRHITRKRPPRPVHFNTWEAIYFRHEAKALSDLVARAAEVGAERFVLDDGWFRGRNDDSKGLGDWSPDPAKYPEGLGPLIAEVRAAGMKFGLWVEPEMVNPDSDLYRAHPDWAQNLDPLPRPTARNQLVLDLTRAEVTDYLFATLDNLLRDHAIAYLKWDMNRDLAAAGSAGIAASHRQTRAFYALLDRLRTAHPEVEIESCSSGGGRADYGALRRTDRIWTSDSNDALERQRIQRGFSLFFPPEVMGAHIGPALCHVTGRAHRLSFRAATALFGHLGLELDLRALSREDTAELARLIALYKRFRALLHEGSSVTLPVADPGRIAYGVVSADLREALFAIAQIDLPALDGSPLVRLRGLDPRARYRVRLLDLEAPARAIAVPHLARFQGDGVLLRGDALLRAGMNLTIPWPETALLIHAAAENE